MFSGQSAINMDAKGRLAIPAKHRAAIAEESDNKVVVTKNPNASDRCLLIYPWHEWQPVQRNIMKMSNLDPAVRAFQRLMVGSAEELDLDGSGRILISANLREFAKLDKHVILMGMNNKFELWSADILEASESQFLEDPDQFTDEMRNLVI